MFVLCLVAYAAGISLFRYGGEWVGNLDGVRYIEAARGFVTGDFSQMYQFRPGYIFSLSIPCSMGLAPMTACRLHTAFWSALSLVALFVLLRRHCHLALAMAFTALVGTTPLFISYSRQVMPPMQTGALALLGTYLLCEVRFRGDGSKSWKLPAAALLYSLAFTTHPAFLLYAGPLGLCVLGYLLFAPDQGPVPGRLRRCVYVLAMACIPILAFEVLTRLLLISGAFVMTHKEVYLPQLLAYLTQQGSQALTAAEGAIGTHVREKTILDLTGILFGNHPLLWLLLATGLAALSVRGVRRRDPVFLVAICALLPVVYWGLRYTHTRDRDVLYSFPGIALAMVAGSVTMLNILRPGAGKHRLARLAMGAGMAGCAWILVLGSFRAPKTAVSVGVDVLRSPFVMTETARRVLKGGGTGLSVNGSYGVDLVTRALRFVLWDKVSVWEADDDPKTGSAPRSCARGENFALYYRMWDDLMQIDRYLGPTGYHVCFFRTAPVAHFALIRKDSVPRDPPERKPPLPKAEKNLLAGAEWVHAIESKKMGVVVAADREVFATKSPSMAIRIPRGYVHPGAGLHVKIDIEPGRDYVLEGYLLSEYPLWFLKGRDMRLAASTTREDFRPADLVDPPEFGEWNRFRGIVSAPPDAKNMVLIMTRAVTEKAWCPAYTIRFDNIALRPVSRVARAIGSVPWRRVGFWSEAALATFVGGVSLLCWRDRRKRRHENPTDN